MENIENIAQINSQGLEGALEELGIKFGKSGNGVVYIKVKKGIYLSRNGIKKRTVVNNLLPDNPLEPYNFGFEARRGEGLWILLQPIEELSQELSFMGKFIVND